MSNVINPEKLVIQKVEVSELDPFWSLLAEMGEDKEDEYFTGVLEAQSVGRVELLTMSYEGKICGYGILSWRPKYSLFKKLGVPEVQDLNVLSSHRRRGIASAFIAYCEEEARKRKCEYMGIGVGLLASFGPAQRLYIKLGYEPDGQGINYDRQQVAPGEFRPVDENLCLMLLKAL